MKKLFILCLNIFLLWGCQEAPLQSFEQKNASIYFYIDSNSDVTTLSRSFAAISGDELIVDVPVRCSGLPGTEERYFHVTVIDSLTDAVAGVDYEPLSENYSFPSEVYQSTFPVRLYRSDAVKNGTVCLALKIDKSMDFIPGDKERNVVFIKFSDYLEKPENWDYSLGEWSRVKHLKFLELTGLTDYPSSADWSANYYYYSRIVVRQLKAFYTENYPQYDENGNIIEPW